VSYSIVEKIVHSFAEREPTRRI